MKAHNHPALPGLAEAQDMRNQIKDKATTSRESTTSIVG